MAFIIYGSRKISVGIFEPPVYQCPNCEELDMTYVIIYSFYYHIFWIPLFPFKKEAIGNCSCCGFVRDEFRFGPILVKKFAERKKDFKHPWWTWSFCIILGILIILGLVF